MKIRNLALFFCSTLAAIQEQPTVVFVHGTFPPLVSTVLHTFDIPLGLTKGTQFSGYLHGKIPSILASAAGSSFNLEHTYLFGWSGSLSFSQRRKASHDLYKELKKLAKPLVIIGHSHGCNVALHLAGVAAAHKDTEFSIDRLVLLAPPVQYATKQFVKDPVFKKVYSFYSERDLLQVLDPQGLALQETQKEQQHSSVFLFSERVFPPSAHLVQTRILFDAQDPWHIDFICERFLSQLPRLIELLDERAAKQDHHKFIISLKSGFAKPIVLHASH